MFSYRRNSDNRRTLSHESSFSLEFHTYRQDSDRKNPSFIHINGNPISLIKFVEPKIPPQKFLCKFRLHQLRLKEIMNKKSNQIIYSKIKLKKPIENSEFYNLEPKNVFFLFSSYVET